MLPILPFPAMRNASEKMSDIFAGDRLCLRRKYRIFLLKIWNIFSGLVSVKG